jgi:DNA-binding LytR/AlgR family response regulator
VTIRTLIVDDEPLARERLRALLADRPSIAVIGECASGADALETIRRERPDLVLLDVQMPELDGFEVLQAIAPEEWPAVIFVTAYDQYALRAFDVNAVDYLLKPFDRARFERAIGRAEADLGERRNAVADARLLALVEDRRPDLLRQRRRDRLDRSGRQLRPAARRIDHASAQGHDEATGRADCRRAFRAAAPLGHGERGSDSRAPTGRDRRLERRASRRHPPRRRPRR